MFGYVVPDKGNLTIREYALYRAHYCGICRETGRLFGQAARFTVNYDIVFLSLFMHDYHALRVDLKKKGCAANPFRKKPVVTSNALLSKLAALNVLFSYFKVKDDAADGGGFKNAAAALALRRAYKKARRALPRADGVIAGRGARLAELERAKCPRPDEAADCFASMLSECAAELGEGAAQDGARRGDLTEFFYHLGRWVYLTDALDDLDEDWRAGRYNPFIAEAGGAYGGRTAFMAAAGGEIENSLFASAGRMAAALEKFNFTQCQNLLRNIAFCGISNTTRELLAATKKLKRARV